VSIEITESEFKTYQEKEKLDRAVKNGPRLNRVVFKSPHVELHQCLRLNTNVDFYT